MIIDTGKEGFDFSQQKVMWACVYDVTWQVLRMGMGVSDADVLVQSIAKARAYINGTGDGTEKIFRSYRARRWIYTVPINRIETGWLVERYRLEIDLDYEYIKVQAGVVVLDELMWDWNNVRKGLANLLDADPPAWWSISQTLKRRSYESGARQEYNYFIMLYQEALTNYGRRSH